MAQLEVEPKKNNNWWMWLLAALVALALIFLLMRGCNDKKTVVSGAADTTAAVVDDATDDWDIDRNAPAAAYDEITDEGIDVRGNENYAIYSVDETILFDSDQAAVKEDAADKLKMIAASAEKRFSGGQVRIYGYTDSEGSAGYNKELAAKRTEAVQNWLVQNGSITAERISLNPVGEAAPVASNATEAGKAQNRRVEIAIRK